jgi:hypothetical protein
MEGVLTDTPWLYLPTLSRLGLALAIGLYFPGLEVVGALGVPGIVLEQLVFSRLLG